MQQDADLLEDDLSGLTSAEWREEIERIAEANGMFQSLGPKHLASFIDQGNTLLVTFETIQGIQSLSAHAHPLGFDLVKSQGWSHLCLVSDGDTWFRDQQLYGFFDQLVDDGFFEEFDKVVFYGAGPCGYAAAAFSVAAPGATVLAVQPQATLDPRIAIWDDRFTEMRRVSFTDRYGYAPDMMDGAAEGFVIFDPQQSLDAMHASLFARSNVTLLRTNFLGEALQTRFIEMQVLYQLISLAGHDKLTEPTFNKLLRARRKNPIYLRNLLARLEREERPYLTMMMCRNVNERVRMPRFRRRYQALLERAEAGEFRAPPERD